MFKRGKTIKNIKIYQHTILSDKEYENVIINQLNNARRILLESLIVKAQMNVELVQEIKLWNYLL